MLPRISSFAASPHSLRDDQKRIKKMTDRNSIETRFFPWFMTPLEALLLRLLEVARIPRKSQSCAASASASASASLIRGVWRLPSIYDLFPFLFVSEKAPNKKGFIRQVGRQPGHFVTSTSTPTLTLLFVTLKRWSGEMKLFFFGNFL